MTHSERAYFDGDHCQHVAAYFEALRLARIGRVAAKLAMTPVRAA